jgi:NAD+ dependent glucose-6-phosphate dehydrogenase
LRIKAGIAAAAAGRIVGVSRDSRLGLDGAGRVIPTIVITGAAGNIGSKLSRHFASLGWKLDLLDIDHRGDPDRIQVFDLAEWNEDWVRRFRGADVVVHLAGEASPYASWSAVQRSNIDLTLNVYEAAVRQGVKRVIFASSNWVLAGHRCRATSLGSDAEPQPVNAYGTSKLVGEVLGRSFSRRWGLSVICLRIGVCLSGPDNRPGPHIDRDLWGQRMWLSDRDMCQGFEKAVLAPDGLSSRVLNLMSRNDGMAWDLEETRREIGYQPLDHSRPEDPDLMPASGNPVPGLRLAAVAGGYWLRLSQAWRGR